MTFFYDLNKKLDTIREKPETTHKQLNERDMSRAAKGYEKYGKKGMEALAKAGRDGKALDPVRIKYDKYDDTVEESIKDKAKLVLPQGVLREIQKFYYDTAQGHHEGAMAALRVLVPPSQILFGTDYPYRPGAEVRQGLADRSFTGEQRQAIDRGNALRLMPQLARLSPNLS